MITVRQIQRLWNGKAYARLLEQLMAPRPEASERLLSHLLSVTAGSLPAAALMVVRLDELAQSYVPLFGELVRAIVAAQRSDGSWGDVMTTALCLRALMCGQGHGTAIDLGMDSLASLQKEEGIWPSIPVKRMPADAFASAYVLLQLNESELFRHSVRFSEAMKWFESNELALDEDTRKLWGHAKRRAVWASKRSVSERCVAERAVTERGPALGRQVVSIASQPDVMRPKSEKAGKNFWDLVAAVAS
jgi:hypothetical protein